VAFKSKRVGASLGASEEHSTRNGTIVDRIVVRRSPA